MITFDYLGDYRNAIVLCPTCHVAFDRTSYMGWVFLPTDLKFFIDWEKKDFARRQTILEQQNTTPARIFPDEEDYEKHMRFTRKVTDPDDGLCRGGLYDRLVLDGNMFPPVLREAYRTMGLEVIPGPHPQGPKRWHGAPMAAISRGFLVTGAAWMRLPEKQWTQLRELQLLYSKEPSLLPATTATEGDGGQQISCEEEQASQDMNVSRQILGCDAADWSETSPPQGPVPANRHRDSYNANDFDSAIEITSSEERQNGRRKRLREGVHRESHTDEAENSTQSHRKRRRKDEARSEEQEELGVDKSTWCFGPASTSNDKVTVHLGRTIDASNENKHQLVQ